VTVEVTIRGLGASGEGVGSHEGLTMFVEGALPGERVRARITLQKPRYLKGELVEVLKPSPERVTPPCPYFGSCGGCQLQHLSYAGQLQVKRQRVIDAFERVGGLKDPPVEPTLESSPFHYRHKIQMPVAHGQLGLYRRGTHDLIPIDGCLIHCERGEEVVRQIRDQLPEGVRYVVVRTAHGTDDILVTLVSRDPPTNRLAKLAESLNATGVVHNLNRAEGNRILGERFTTLAGRPHLEERLGGLTFRLSAAAFFQVNPPGAEQLYALALEMAALGAEESCLDAYCGVGTLTLLAAQHCRQATGIEVVPQAIADARVNASLNGITNAQFHASTVEKLIGKLEEVDCVFLNPPRKGCEPEVLEVLQRWAPKRIVYISCDPATLARDCARLTDYRVERVQPVDMFPQTAHVENVSLLLNI
jgi:23S rRNA (uracil1939-C5)-methyltransferase